MAPTLMVLSVTPLTDSAYPFVLIQRNINEVKKQTDASAALKYLQATYHYDNPDFDFPTLSDIIEWRT